jgi:hypothetical protein
MINKASALTIQRNKAAANGKNGIFSQVFIG